MIELLINYLRCVGITPALHLIKMMMTRSTLDTLRTTPYQATSTRGYTQLATMLDYTMDGDVAAQAAYKAIYGVAWVPLCVEESEADEQGHCEDYAMFAVFANVEGDIATGCL